MKERHRLYRYWPYLPEEFNEILELPGPEEDEV